MSDLLKGLKKALATARKSGAPQSIALESSPDFFDARRRLALASTLKAFRAKLAAARETLEGELGAGRVRRDESLEASVTWNVGGASIRLDLEHPDKELPVTLWLRVELEELPPAKRKPPKTCACKELLAFRGYDPLGAGYRELRKLYARVERTLELVATTDHAEMGRRRLYRCRACNGLRQGTGGSSECVFAVPEIAIEEWRLNPYANPFDLARHAQQLKTYYATADRTTSDTPCRRAECDRLAVRLSVFCFEHHVDGLPPPPPGRSWTPGG